MRAVSLPDASRASEHTQLQQETAALQNFNSPYVGYFGVFRDNRKRRLTAVRQAAH
jgi:hypothetical protein